MQFSVTKHISPQKKHPFKAVINMLILAIAIPVILIAAMSLSLYFLFTWFKSFFIKEGVTGSGEETYHLEINMVSNEFLQMTMIEDELDVELTKLNEAWQNTVYNEETCLYRARTVPLVSGLDGSVCCFYSREYKDGILLQMLPQVITDDNLLNSQLIFLSYLDLKLTLVEQLGAYFLFNDEKNANLIQGFNKREKIEIGIKAIE